MSTTCSCITTTLLWPIQQRPCLHEHDHTHRHFTIRQSFGATYCSCEQAEWAIFGSFCVSCENKDSKWMNESYYGHRWAPQNLLCLEQIHNKQTTIKHCRMFGIMPRCGKVPFAFSTVYLCLFLTTLLVVSAWVSSRGLLNITQLAVVTRDEEFVGCTFEVSWNTVELRWLFCALI